jgi:hypothetical protein
VLPTVLKLCFEHGLKSNQLLRVEHLPVRSPTNCVGNRRLCCFCVLLGLGGAVGGSIFTPLRFARSTSGPMGTLRVQCLFQNVYEI